MSAGGSASRRSVELIREADALFELSKIARHEAACYQVASRSEDELSGLLRPLNSLGWRVLEDRLWPGSRKANVDFLLVGPGGVVVLDAKAWAEVTVHGDAVFRGDERQDDEVDKLRRLSDSVAESIAHTGLTRASVAAAMVFTGRSMNTTVGSVAVLGDVDVASYLSRLRRRLDAAQVEFIAAALEKACPPMPEAQVQPTRLFRRLQPAPRVSAPPPALINVEDLTQALLDSALAGPIEEWMTFLHPEQNRLVSAHWSGPARVRGPAGTGKTVVGLHRAVHLAERSSEPVLFVSFVKTLPVVLAALARRLSPTIGDRIEFTGVHQLASRCLSLVGESCRIDTSAVDTAFLRAWHAEGAAKTLGRLDERPTYWREEIDHVIKGRALEDFGAYQSLQRIGRKTPMRLDDRAAMWDLYVAYEAQLSASGVEDFNDLLIRAHATVRKYPSLFRYSSVIVDEVQDLNLAAVRLLHALAGDGSNPLLIIGDGQQSVYPGGFSLAEAGINVTGRAAVLKHNYRNTVEILVEANRLVRADTFDDLDGLPELGARESDATRHGHVPIQVHETSSAGLARSLVAQIRATHDRLGTPWGEMAVLAERTRDVQHYQRVLARADIPFVELTAYDGETSNCVKIGTIKRAKGLEFTYVLLPGLREVPPDMHPGETNDSYLERCERWRRELYVAMTRAREGLWLGYLVADGGSTSAALQ